MAAIDSGWVEYGEVDDTAGETFPKALLRNWLPRDYFDEVQRAFVYEATDDVISRLQGLDGLRELHLYSCAHVTGAGLGNLQALHHLQSLDMGGTDVTDSALVELHVLTALRDLEN